MPTQPQNTTKPYARRRAVAAVVAVCALAAVGGAAWLLVRGAGDDSSAHAAAPPPAASIPPPKPRAGHPRIPATAQPRAQEGKPSDRIFVVGNSAIRAHKTWTAAWVTEAAA